MPSPEKIKYHKTQLRKKKESPTSEQEQCQEIKQVYENTTN